MIRERQIGVRHCERCEASHGPPSRGRWIAQRRAEVWAADLIQWSCRVGSARGFERIA